MRKYRITNNQVVVINKYVMAKVGSPTKKQWDAWQETALASR